MPDDRRIKSIRPWSETTVGPRVLTRPDETELVIGIDLMIDAKVDLVAVHIGPQSGECIRAAVTTNPTKACRIQAVGCVDRTEIIRQRHLGENALNPAARIEAGPQRVAAENAEGLKVASGAGRPERVAG